MSFLVPRLVAGKTVPATRRAYSFFSSKPGGGRYFTSAKPPKPTTSQAQASGVQPVEPNNEPNTNSQASVATVQAEDSSLDPPAVSTEQSPTPAPVPSTPIIDTPIAPLLVHPFPTRETVTLHSFFSLHRPLLLLPMHLSQPLFNNHPSADDLNDLEDVGRDREVALGTGEPVDRRPFAQSEEESGEADADAARLLARTFVMNKVASIVDWQHQLSGLGDKEASAAIEGIDLAAQRNYEVLMDSVKRKRRKKMTKHKYKKRRKAQRWERRRLGK